MRTIPLSSVKASVRAEVLRALDLAVQEATGCTQAGWRDEDLPCLFAAIDAQVEQTARRINAPDSRIVGSCAVSVDEEN